MSNYLNSQTLPAARPPVKDTDPLFESTLVEEYDVNSIIPVPQGKLETSLTRVEPLIPSIHGEQLAEEFMKGHDDPDVFFYPFPYGRPYTTKRETYVYLEKQRRRPNVLHFAIIDKNSNRLAGTCALGCSPDQATLDVRIMSLKIFPQFRGTCAVYHATYLLLSHALNPISEGGCGLVRCAWRNAQANPRSARVAEKMGFTLEGPMRCYEVSHPYEGYPYDHFQTAVDGTSRLIEDASVYSMTHFDWLRDDKKQHLEALCSRWT
ncbi:GNAT family acetyltransferase [Ceratobasidium sp. AG-Ba]|nr:GNAT family acetyltransferase [Ceratobasidium sp. AG-Ba]